MALEPGLETVVIPRRRGRLLLILLVSIVVVALGGWLLLPPYANTGFDEIVAALVAVPLLTIVALFALARLLSRKPALVIDAGGITDNVSVVAPGLIPWSDFAGAGIASVGKFRLVGIQLHDQNAYLARLNGLKRFVVQINAALTGYPCNIPVTDLPYTVEELLATVRRHAARQAG